MNRIISFKREDHCVKCHSDRSLELYDKYNKPFNYTYILDNMPNNLEVFNRREISYIKCKKCGATYKVHWENEFPKPLINKNILNIFINNIFKNK